MSNISSLGQTYHVRIDAGGFLGIDHGDAKVAQVEAQADHFDSPTEAHEAAMFFGLAKDQYLVVPDQVADAEEGT